MTSQVPGGGRREDWATTTHDWSVDVDDDHLRDVRSRPDHYAPGGVPHLVLEVLAYADDEARALGRRGHARVVRHGDGSVSVRDDGRGTDTRRDGRGRVVRKPVMATPDVRFTDVTGTTLPDGSPRRGASVVAALSTWLEHTNHRADGAWTQRYAHGVPASDLIEATDDGGTGTTVRFLPDLELVADGSLDARALAGFAWLGVTCADE
ncbi:ATP-binding protein [Thalassiella azotivora]